MKVKRVGIGQVLFVLLFATCGYAMVSGTCSNCHTMHNSQNGEVVDDSGPNSALLKNNCVGCHSSSGSSTYYEMDGTKVPVVLYTVGTAPTDYLAGGNFYWVKEELGGDDSKGHNVFLGQPDENLNEAPGSAISCGNTSCHSNLSNSYTSDTFDLKGIYGCQGCHIGVKHHANDHSNGEGGAVTEESQGWYRFLSGHKFNSLGVQGYESGTWEAGLHDGNSHVGVASHNEYLGKADTDGGYGFGVDGGLGSTTTAFCTGCHGRFHNEQKDANAMWVRHPSDAVIPAEGEYNSVSSYDPLSPVARPEVPASASGTATPGTDMVMCLSCHRPHGSPYPDMLRWDYSAQISGGGEDGTGCFYCHTSKDD